MSDLREYQKEAVRQFGAMHAMRMAERNGEECGVGNFESAMKKIGGIITVRTKGAGAVVRFHEAGKDKERRFGSTGRAKAFVRHLRYCQRANDGPLWGAPVDARPANPYSWSR